jgi:hypothetical protein
MAIAVFPTPAMLVIHRQRFSVVGFVSNPGIEFHQDGRSSHFMALLLFLFVVLVFFRNAVPQRSFDALQSRRPLVL